MLAESIRIQARQFLVLLLKRAGLYVDVTPKHIFYIWNHLYENAFDRATDDTNRIC